MRLGLIARPDSRGLGIQCKAVHDQLHPVKTLVVDCPSQNPLPIRRHWYPEAQWVKRLPTNDDINHFLDGLDAVYTAETGYNQYLWQAARDRGIRTVLHANYEFLDRTDNPTVWAAPSRWHIQDWPEGTIHLPVPIETDRFTLTNTASATNFLHVVGRPAIHDRNGTVDFLQALTMVETPITATITCQMSGYIGRLLNDHHIRIPSRVTLHVQSTDTANYWDLYTGQHALILPRRFGGLCLPANEAIGAGIPVIMPDISPNNLWLPPEWLVPARHAGNFRAKQHIDFVRTDPRLLAQKIDELATPGFYEKAATQARILRSEYSWEALAPKYREVLG